LYDRALWALRTWLDSWPGIGHVAVGMHRQGYDLQLSQYDDRGWRATFYTTGMEHSPTSATGTAWERTPWRATQRATWEALKRATSGSPRTGNAQENGMRPSLRVRTVTESAHARPDGDETEALIREVALVTVAPSAARPRGARFGTLVHAALATVALDASLAQIAEGVRLQARVLIRRRKKQRQRLNSSPRRSLTR
jgi:hypothetical protein